MLVVHGSAVLGTWDGSGQYGPAYVEDGVIYRDPRRDTVHPYRDVRGSALELVTASGERCTARVTDVRIGLSIFTDEPLVPPDQDQDCVDDPCPVDPSYAWDLARTRSAESGQDVTYFFARLEGDCVHAALLAAPELDATLTALPARDLSPEERAEVLTRFRETEAGSMETARPSEGAPPVDEAPRISAYGEGARRVLDVSHEVEGGCGAITVRFIGARGGEEALGDRFSGPVLAVFATATTELVVYGSAHERDVRDVRRGRARVYRIYDAVCSC